MAKFSKRALGAAVAIALMTSLSPIVERAGAHIFICPAPYLGCPVFQVGTAPLTDGQGWLCEAYVDLPNESAMHLITAEQYANTHEPDVTFQTHWIDYPPGPQAFGLDTSFETLEDFLGDNHFKLPPRRTGPERVG